MKQTLVIGSTVTDVILTVERLPHTGREADILSQEMRIGGCAFNTSEMLRFAGIPYTLCSPLGGGVYGDFVRAELALRGITPFVETPERANGCCYCIVDAGGERTFMSHHGAEYLFKKEWLEQVPQANLDSIYFCGIEIDEATGNEIIEFTEERRSATLFFAPGPLICRLSPEKMKRILALHPIIHLNHDEAAQFTGCTRPADAAKAIYRRTGNTVIVTLGKDGACIYEAAKPLFGEPQARCVQNKTYTIPAVPSPVADTIGAGDAHIGSLIAALKKGKRFAEAVQTANRIAAAVVSVSGAAAPEPYCRSIFAAL
ncbi:MAG TPA: carbohydrate kinase family protein [Candidatus Treponema faecavium]|nr:carbohydrate kinase family protein [Candidatus Treponema faecavium]